MCGICGVIHSDRTRHVDARALKNMTSSMTHRGPDDEGCYLNGHVGLGHRRLSIIDLTTGAQPIYNETKSVLIVFNGEIYNCRELQKKLESGGHHFYTTSDTEVIVHAYEEYGLACVEQLNGMFAFALWDVYNNRLVLARDRTGIKPLYYADLPGVFVFGSELKAVTVHPAVSREIDRAALDQYLTFEHIPSPSSIFKDVRKLPPGSLLVHQDGHTSIRRYWDMSPAQSENERPRSEESYRQELIHTLREAVRKELISDVPLGVFLSGGIDSSAVAALMCELAPGSVNSFSVAFEDPSFDESSYARQVADLLGMQHYEAVLTPDMMLNLIPNIAEILDEPLGDSSIIPTYLLCRFAREHVKAALGGDGGDELFGGYPTIKAHRLFQYYERLVPRPVRRSLIPAIVNRLPVSFENISFDFKARRFASGYGLEPTLRHHMWMGSFTEQEKAMLLRPAARAPDSAVIEILRGHEAACGCTDTLNRILYCDMKLYLEGDILTKVDRASMANSLEVRVPVLNNIMLDFAQRLPVRYKLKGLTTKHLLKQALRGMLPDSIINRRKKGFNMPVAKWLLGPLKSLAQELLSEDRLRRQGLFEPAYVNRLLTEHFERRKDNRKLLWTLMVFQLWHDRRMS